MVPRPLLPALFLAASLSLPASAVEDPFSSMKAKPSLPPGKAEIEAAAGWSAWWGSLKARSRAFDASRQDLYGDGAWASLGFRRGIRPWGPIREVAVSARTLEIGGTEGSTHRLKFGDEVFPRGSRVSHDLSIQDVFVDTLFLHYRHVELELDSPGYDKSLQQDMLLFTLGDLGWVLPSRDGGSRVFVASGRFSIGDLTLRRFATMLELDIAFGRKLSSDWVLTGGLRANYFYMTERLDNQASVGPYVSLSRSW